MTQFITLFLMGLFVNQSLAATPEDFNDRARAMESKAHLNGIYAAERATAAEMGKFTSDFKAMGFEPTGPMRAHIFTSIEKVPKNYLPMIKEEMKPSVTDKAFRILTILHTGNKIYVNSIDQDKKLLEKIYVIAPKDKKYYTLSEQYNFKSEHP